VLALLWVWRSRTPWGEIGYTRPRSWALGAAVGLAFGFVFKLVMKAVVMPLLGADPINHAYHFLVGNSKALPRMLYLVVVGAGFGEETLFRGYLFERLGKLFGASAWAKAFTVLLTAVGFGLAHYSNQGLPGVQQATIVGLVFGVIFAITGRIWMLMVAHAAFDLTALAIIYYDLESAVGHFFFK
jgi:CAAX protease family protein